jgi:microcystin-dependent protein
MKNKLILYSIILSFSVPLFAQQEGFIGEIRMFAGNFAPRSWALCNGQLLPIAQNQALFSILGTTYGGDGRTTFALPDLRGRVPISAGQGPGLTDKRLGQQGGQETVTLNANQMPVHNHSAVINADSSVATSDQPRGALPARNAAATPQYGENATATLNTATVTVNNAGGSQPHENMPPYTTVNYIICTQGIFPSRP